MTEEAGVIDMGCDFGAAQEEAEAALIPAPAGVYEVQCVDFKPGTTSAGQKRIMWTFTIVNAPDPKVNGKKINHFTNLPDNGNMTGVGFFTKMLTALGNPWSGRSFDPNSCKGLSAQANVIISDDGKWNNISSFVGE